jgi:exopolysaccharide production protein ExoZ
MTPAISVYLDRRATGAGNTGVRSTFLGVQILRGAAAFLVLLQHNSLIMSERVLDPSLKIEFGQSRVDIFFAISGFVMVLVTATSWGCSGVAGPFLIRRLIRIVPLYWIFTLIKIIFVLAIPSLALSTIVTPWHATASFLFFPDRFPEPVLQVGWTLSFEMLFYLLFASLLFVHARPIFWLSSFLVILAVVGLFRTDDWPPLTKLMNPLLIEFILGMLIGLATIRKQLLPVRLALVLAAISIAAILLSETLGAEARPIRLLVWGVPSALLLASVVALEDWIRAWPLKWFIELGAASYSLYLLHGFVVGFIWVAASKLHLGHGLLSYVVYVLAIGVSIAAAFAVHYRVELPLTRLLGRKYQCIVGLEAAPSRSIVSQVPL